MLYEGDQIRVKKTRIGEDTIKPNKNTGLPRSVITPGKTRPSKTSIKKTKTEEKMTESSNRDSVIVATTTFLITGI